MTRTELAMAMLREEWDCAVVLLTRYDAAADSTERATLQYGNALLCEKLVEEEASAIVYGTHMEGTGNGDEEEEIRKG